MFNLQRVRCLTCALLSRLASRDRLSTFLIFYYHGCRGGLDEKEARWFFKQLILALDYCHKMVRRGLSTPTRPALHCHRWCLVLKSSRAVVSRATGGCALADNTLCRAHKACCAFRAGLHDGRAAKRQVDVEQAAQGVSNRDIKLENTLLDRLAPGHKPVVKLCGAHPWAAPLEHPPFRVSSACTPSAMDRGCWSAAGGFEECIKKGARYQALLYGSVSAPACLPGACRRYRKRFTNAAVTPVQISG